MHRFVDFESALAFLMPNSLGLIGVGVDQYDLLVYLVMLQLGLHDRFHLV